jgi:hypothetical protein
VKALVLYAGLVIASTAASVLIGSYVERQTAPQIGLITILALFFTSLVVSWIATVFVIDGSLRNFRAGQEQIEAEKKGRDYMNRYGRNAES